LKGTASSLERSYRKAAGQKKRQAKAFAATTAGDCPADGDEVTTMDVDNPDGESDSIQVPTGGAVAGTDYCIVYQTDPKTGGTKADIEATIKTTLERYKTNIYKNDFAAVGDYTFKPIFVIMDFGNDSIWPPSKQIGGAFVARTSNEMKMPVIYMPTDLQAVTPYKTQASYTAELGKRLWNGTIAHEVQHAIISYFRTKVTADGDEDLGSLDEGLAHFMEDLFGYGSEQFSQVAKPYLENWAKNANPPIHATDSDLMERGAAHTFLYYLTSQKGGITFTNGIATGGGGLDYINEIVKSANNKNGPENLAAKFGGDWLQTVANYFGALAIDGTALSADATLKVQDPQSISDMNGGTAKQFGMHFNGFGDLSATPWAAWEPKVGTTTDVSSTYYATSPVLYTVKDPAAKVKLTTDTDAANTAVIKVRVK
jgi:hypothetical protein